MLLTLSIDIALSIFMLLGLVMTPFGLPGNWLIFACGIIYGFTSHWSKFGIGYITFLVGIALAGEVLEFFSAAVGARRFGSSRGGEIAAFVGSIAGLLIGSGIAPIIGSLIGAFAGAFLGAFLYEFNRMDDTRHAARAGLGALLGRTVAMGIKELIGLIMAGSLVYYFFA